jgi:hypothetical protein
MFNRQKQDEFVFLFEQIADHKHPKVKGTKTTLNVCGTLVKLEVYEPA